MSQKIHRRKELDTKEYNHFKNVCQIQSLIKHEPELIEQTNKTLPIRILHISTGLMNHKELFKLL